MDLCHWLSFAYSIVGSIASRRAIPGLKEARARDLFAVRVPRLLLPRERLKAGPSRHWPALILHSVEYTAALFIHIAAEGIVGHDGCAAEHEAAFPGILPMPLDAANGSGLGYVELITPG